MNERRPTPFFASEHTISDGWNHRFFWIAHILIGWATTLPGEPWEGPWIGVRFAKTTTGCFARFGIRGFACAIGFVK